MSGTSKLLGQLKNPYGTPPSFEQLAADVPELAEHIVEGSSGQCTIDWKNDESVRCLTRALLKRDFDLLVELPRDRLCPTVPSRLEYCLWVLKLSLLTLQTPRKERSRVIGLDIGTGASCIYPLLLARTIERLRLPQSSQCFISERNSGKKVDGRIDFHLLATEIDKDSLTIARSNIKNNKGCEGRIKVLQADEGATDLIGANLLEQNLGEGEMIDFVMCNPPFYTSMEEIELSARQKELEPFAVCTAANNELITTGGEVEFVKRMIEESLRIGPTIVRWFTSLIGKYSSISPLVALLREHRISNYHLHLLRNSGQTRRWILSWSLQEERIPAILFSQTNESLEGEDQTSFNLRKLLPQPPVLRFHSQELSPDIVYDSSTFPFPLDDLDIVPATALLLLSEKLLSDLGDAVKTERVPSFIPPEDSTSSPSDSSTTTKVRTSLKAKENSWSRSARRRKRDEESTMSTAPPPPPPSSENSNECNLLEVDFEISLVQVQGAEDGRGDESRRKRSIQLRGEWVRGLDSRNSGIAWESLWGVVKRRLKDMLAVTAAEFRAIKSVARGREAVVDEGEGEERKRRKVD
ncbi:hypothetical protein JCM5350_000126 [Sporobolomyces pararoseus]